MDIRVRAPGWTVQDFGQGVTGEVKVMTYQEGSEFEDDMRTLLEGGQTNAAITGKWFQKYVRNIKGLTVNGKALTRPEDVLDPAIGYSRPLATVVVTAVNRIMEVNRVSEEEGKNSDPPPAPHGEAAGTESK